MTPTQSEVDLALNEIAHRTRAENANRKLARQAIAEYRLSVDDITEARVNGTRSRWPADPDSTYRLAQIGQVNVPERKSRLYPIMLLVAAGLLIFALLRSQGVI